MTNSEDPYEKPINKLNKKQLDQIKEMYRGYGEYYNNIMLSMSSKISNWAFTLNTGGLAATITFMGAAVKWQNISCNELVPFIFMVVIFSFGIMMIVLAAHFEHKRFDEKGYLLDQYFDEFNNEKMTATDFIKKLPPKTPCCDALVPKFELASYSVFFLGIITSLFILFFKVTTLQ